MVVAIHTFPKCRFDTLTGVGQIFIRQLVGCPVPLFLALSGYFVGRKSLVNRHERLTFWKKQIPKVYIPALIWSFYYFALSIKDGSNPLLATGVLVSMGYSIYYFIALIIQYYLLLPVLQTIDNPLWGKVILAISVLSGVIIAWFGANTLPLTIYAGPFTTWIVFFYMGVILSHSDRAYTINRYIPLLAMSIVFMMVEAFLLVRNSRGGVGLKTSVYIYSILVILILFSKKVETSFNEKKYINKAIIYIGKISFGIYLIHCIVLNILGRFVTIDEWFTKWCMTTTISVLIIMVSRKCLPDTINKYIGFK